MTLFHGPVVSTLKEFRCPLYTKSADFLISIYSFQHEGIEVTLTQSPKPIPDIKDLDFGAAYSDHMLTVDWTKEKGWAVPKIAPYGNFSLSPALSAFHYSTEVHVCTYV